MDLLFHTKYREYFFIVAAAIELNNYITSIIFLHKKVQLQFHYSNHQMILKSTYSFSCLLDAEIDNPDIMIS